MDARETKKLTTPSGIEYEIKTYLVASEMHAFEGAAASALDVTGYQNGSPEFGEVDLGKVSKAAEYKLIDVAVVSLAGTADSIRERVLNLRMPDYNAIKAEIEKLVDDPN